MSARPRWPGWVFARKGGRLVKYSRKGVRPYFISKSHAKIILRNRISFDQCLCGDVQAIGLSIPANSPHITRRNGSYTVELIRNCAVVIISITGIRAGDNTPGAAIPMLNDGLRRGDFIAITDIPCKIGYP